jgi:hypothetical protein
MPSAILKGLGTIVWGTDNVLGAPSGAVVESCAITPKNGEPIEIENNPGFTITEVVLDDGFNAKVQCLYDSAKAWPTTATGNVALTLVDIANANANAISYKCIVGATPGLTYGRKKELMIELSLHYRPAVTGI